jgi:hypothetical protein
VNGVFHTFYYDATRGNLRHAWADSAGWHFENLDGDPGSIARYDRNVGQTPAVTAEQPDGTIQLFY